MIFYRPAYEAACQNDRPTRFPELTDAHFESISALDEALGWLKPEQLCDAVYGDWLLQLDAPAGEVLLSVRSLLIGQGALAANYLAELAQNADDASDGWEGEVRLILEADWLLVINNGRRITPGNLRGLCRFFIHHGSNAIELNAETIGRFGIGFKSCYRIASEVFARSWNEDGELAFRLPISRGGNVVSKPEEERLARVTSHLTAAGTPIGNALLSEPDKLGYCTPEFLPSLPSKLMEVMAQFKCGTQGTAFAFHLHGAGAAEVRERVTGQEHELYELCPLFLPKVRTVQLGESELVMAVGRRLTADSVPGRVSAVRVTLETNRGGVVGRDRFWKLEGSENGDLWQIALHADSSWKLSLAKDAEAGFSLREGGLYAFFPLNDANANFCFRFHLHIKLPTNLSRGNWNDEERLNVRDQIGRAIGGLAEWLEMHAAKRRIDWQVEGLFRREPDEGTGWSREIFEALKLAVRERPLLRTLWGGWRRAEDALAVRLSGASTVRRAWKELCAAAEHVGDRFPFVETMEQIDLGIPAAKGADLRAFFAEAAKHPQPPVDYWRNMMHSILGAEAISAPQIEEALGRVPVELRAGGRGTVAEVMRRAEGAELVEEWHAAFRSASNWLRDDSRRELSIFREPLITKVNRLGTARFSAEWSEVAARLATLDDWAEHGDQFWSSAHEFCPRDLRDELLATLQVKHGLDRWQPLTDVWLLDGSAVQCFHGVVRPWDRGVAANLQAQTTARQRLDAWGLLRPYEIALEEKLNEELADRLAVLIADGGDSSLEILHSPAHANSRDNLPHARWKDLVVSAERSAMKRFLDQHPAPRAGTVYLSRQNADIPFAMRRVLETTIPTYAEAPMWLDAKVWKLIEERGLATSAGFTFVDRITADRRAELAQEILHRFWQWKDHLALGTDVEAAALDELLKDVRGTWPIGLAANSTAILNQLFVRAGMGGDGLMERAWECTIGQPDATVHWHAKALPELLTRVPSIVAACVTSSALHLQSPGEGTEIPRERVHPDILAARGVEEVLAEREWEIVFCSQLNLLWKAAGAPMCEIRDAAFAFDGGRLLVSRMSGTVDQDQYRDVLAIYKSHAPEDAAVVEAMNGGQAPQQVYLSFRGQILKVLRDRLVTEEGYEERHVLRELLQNAESAYASRAGEPLEHCSFSVRSETHGHTVSVVAAHRGRTFNEPDADGKPRADIRRIVSLRAENQNAPDEVGRFNRGFKSIFTVTKHVQVRSGAYDFGIEDLLLLHPADPPPTAERIGETRFTFQCGRTEAQKLFGTSGGRAFGVFHAASFLFLKFVNDIMLEHGGERRHWTLQRVNLGDGWGEVTVEDSAPGEPERFLVFRGISTQAKNRGVGVAIRLGADGVPCEPESAWKRLFLTFPTETSGPCGVLINGDFDTDGGRVDARHSAVNERLLKDAFAAVEERLRLRVQAEMPRTEWLGWARVLALPEAIAWVTANFPNDDLNLCEMIKSLGGILLSAVPHKGELITPSRLMRELAESPYAADWGIARDEWLAPEIDAEVAKIEGNARVRFSLRSFALSLRCDLERCSEVLAGLRAARFRELFNLSAVDEHEWREAIEILTPAVAALPPSPSGQVRFDFEFLRPDDVLEWWHENDDPDDYMLDSAVLWPLFGPHGLDADERRSQLIAWLSTPESAAGRLLWYRMLGFACLMSAGWPVSRVRTFWQEKLEPANFWRATADGFTAANAIFEDIIHAETKGANAAGEGATFWRRIFYDVRKVRHLVYENEFSEELMAVARDEHTAEHLLQFLHTGQLPGERPWRGVIGQSAGSPLFFVVRELRRLRVIPHIDVDASAFFVCTPVRKLAARMGWIEPPLAARYDFESLQECSHQIWKRAREVDATLFSELYDIPLLHFALNATS